jgi:hypothetical protein
LNKLIYGGGYFMDFKNKIPKIDNISPMVLKDSKVYIPSIMEVEEEKAEVDANQK